MTWLDWLALALLLGYTVLGFFTGVVRRVVGIMIIFLAAWLGTSFGVQTGALIQQGSSTTSVADGRILAWFGLFTVMVLLLEGAATMIHDRLQITYVIFNRATGAILGLLTALSVISICTFLLFKAGEPLGGGGLDQVQLEAKDASHLSLLANPIASSIGNPILVVFTPVIPHDPQTFFSNNPGGG